MFDIQTSPSCTALLNDISPEGSWESPRHCPPYQRPGRGGWWDREECGEGKTCAAEAEEIPAAHIETSHTQTGPVPPTGQVPDRTARKAEQGSRLNKWSSESQARSREQTSQDGDGLEKSQDQAYVRNMEWIKRKDLFIQRQLLFQTRWIIGPTVFNEQSLTDFLNWAWRHRALL